MYAEQQYSDRPTMTEAEYLAFADQQEFKHEYAAGVVYAMSGGTFRHNTIAMAAGTHLSNLLGDRDCTVTSSDMRIHIASKKAYRYPDVSIICGDPAFLGERNDTITNPTLLVEVLSPSTTSTDHIEKLAEYTSIDTLQAYILIAQDEPKVEVFQRHDAANWLYSTVSGMDAEIELSLPTGSVKLALAQLYRRVRWDGEAGDSQATP